MANTEQGQDGILLQALELPDEQNAASIRNYGSRRRPDSTPAMEWLRLHSKEYGGQWVALDGSRLIVHGLGAMEVYTAVEADGAYLPMINYIEPADALPFVF